MLDILDPARKFEHVQAIAASGVGVFETLKTISKLTIRTLRRRMTTDEPARPAPRKTISDFSQFKVNNEKTVDPSRTVSAMPIPPDVIGTVIPEIEPEAAEPQVAAAVVETLPEPEPVVDASPQTDAFPEEEAAVDAAVDLFAPEPEPEPEPVASESLDSVFDSEEVPSTQYQPPAAEAAPEQEAEDVFARNERLPEPEAEPEPELVIPQVARASKAAPDVKHVKMRSNMDVMAELESLRKKATTPKAAKKDAEPLVLPRSKRDSQKSIQLSVAPDILARAKTLRLTVSFEDEAGVMQTEERSVDVADASDVQTLSVNLKIDLA
jgi:hypothetical protein